MAKKKSKKRRAATAKTGSAKTGSAKTGSAKTQGAPSQVVTSETHAADALTVGLILSAMATLFAESVALIAKIALLSEPEWRNIEWLIALPRIMLLIAGVTGFVCLILNPVVNRIRRVKLPLAVTVAIAIMAVTPLVTFLVMR